MFGHEIGKLVEGVTKLKGSKWSPRKPSRRRTCANSCWRSPRTCACCLVKLADRLHNMRTLDSCRPKRARRAAEETLEIYAPLARRIGMQRCARNSRIWRSAKSIRKPMQVISGRLNGLADRHQHLIRDRAAAHRKLADRGIDARVPGRRKRAYSIWRKMERKSVGFEQLSDIYGFRVIVKTLDDCYRALGIVHTTWPWCRVASRTTSRRRSRTIIARSTPP